MTHDDLCHWSRRAADRAHRYHAELRSKPVRARLLPGESFGQAAAGHLRVAMTIADAPFRDALQRLVAFAQKVGT